MDTVTIVYISLETVIAVLSVGGNVLVLAAVYINHRLRTVTNQFVASLAAADILVGLIAIPCAIASFLGHPWGNFDACIFMNTIVIVFTQISIFSLLAIACERYVAIKHPYAYARRVTTRNANIVIAVTWIFATLLSLIPLMGWNLGRPDGPVDCAFVKTIDLKFMVYFNFFICVLLPLFVVACIYIYIFTVVRRQTRVIANLRIGANDVASHRKRKQFIRDLQAAKSLSIIVFFFALCWMPIHILNTITVLSPSTQYPFQLLLATIILSHGNSAVNPIIYAFTNRQYRLAFYRMFGGKLSQFTTDTTGPPPTAHNAHLDNIQTISANTEQQTMSASNSNVQTLSFTGKSNIHPSSENNNSNVQALSYKSTSQPSWSNNNNYNNDLT